MSDKTAPDVEWEVLDADGKIWTWARVSVAVLMDIRRELKRLNAAIYCPNFQEIPYRLRKIEGNTRRKKKRAKR